MKFSGGLKPFNSSFIRFSAKEAVVITWVTPSGSLGTKDIGLAVAYSVQATTNNSTSVFYEITAGSLPTGVSLDPATGFISGIPTSVGMYAFTVRASSGRISKEQSFAITTNPVTLTWNTAAGSLGTLNGGHAVPMVSLSATTSNGQPVTYSLLSGSLPPGVSLSASGALYGTTDNSGSASYSFTVRADYAGAVHADRTFTYDVIKDAITWTTPAGSLGSFGGGKILNIALAAVDTAGDPVSYSVVSGALPGSLSIVNGRITGKLDNLNGTSSFTIRASDGITYADQTFTISVASDTVTWITTGGDLGSISGSAPFTKTLAATSTNGDPITYTLQSGDLGGLTISGDKITGNVNNVNAVITFVIRASDGTAFADLSFSLNIVRDVITWTVPSLPLAAANVPYSQTLSAVSSARNPVYFSVISGALPTGLTLSNAGVISGTYTGTTSLNVAATIRATDTIVYTDQSITIPTHAAPTWVSSGSLGVIQIGQSFSYTFSATDTVPVTSYTLAPNSALLPNTTTLSSNATNGTGTLSGFFNNPNAPVFANAAGTLGTVFRQDTVSLRVSASPVGNATTVVNYGLIGDPANSTLPAGVVLLANGAITGTADLYAKDTQEAPVSRYTAPLWTTTSNLGVQYIGNTISIPIQAIGRNSNTSTVTYTLSSLDILPFGLQLGLNGSISGSIDKTSVSLETPISAPPPVWNTGSFLGSVSSANASFTANLSATPTFGSSIASYQVLSDSNPRTSTTNGVMTCNAFLPEGLSMTTAGVISGTTQSGVTAYNEIANSATLPGPTWVTPGGSLGSSTNGNSVLISLSATPPTNGNVFYFVSNGVMPTGTLLSTNATAGTATISGTLDANATTAQTTIAGNSPAGSNTLTVARTFNFTVRAQSNLGGTADQNFSFTVNTTP